MNKEEPLEPVAISGDYDITHLLKYTGPILQKQEPIAEGVDLLDYRNTDENERNISILLSSQGIPFNIERPKLGWRGTQIRMIVTVHRNQCRQAEAILNAAANVGAVDIVEGTEGLYSR